MSASHAAANSSFGEFLAASYASNSVASDGVSNYGSGSINAAEVAVPARDSGISFRPHVAELFSSLGIPLASGGIRGSQLIEWANRSGFHCSKRVLERNLQKGMRWDRLTLDDCTSLMDAVERSNLELVFEDAHEVQQRSHAAGASENNAQEGSSGYMARSTELDVILLPPLEYFRYKCGFISISDVVRQHRPRGWERLIRSLPIHGSGADAGGDSVKQEGRERNEAMGHEDDARAQIVSAMEERLSSEYSVRLDPEAIRLSHRMRLFISTAVVFFLIAVVVQLFMSVLWMHQATDREEQLAGEFATSIALIANEFEIQHLDDIKTELLDSVITERDWILRTLQDTVSEASSMLWASHKQLSIGINDVGMNSLVSSLQRRFDIVATLQLLCSSAAEDDLTRAELVHLVSDLTGRSGVEQSIPSHRAFVADSIDGHMMFETPSSGKWAMRSPTFVGFPVPDACRAALARQLQWVESAMHVLLLSQVVHANNSRSALSVEEFPAFDGQRFSADDALYLAKLVAAARRQMMGDALMHFFSIVMLFTHTGVSGTNVCFEFAANELMAEAERDAATTVIEMNDATTISAQELHNERLAHWGQHGGANASFLNPSSFTDPIPHEVMLYVPVSRHRVKRARSAHLSQASNLQMTAESRVVELVSDGMVTTIPEDIAMLQLLSKADERVVDGIFPISGMRRRRGWCHGQFLVVEDLKGSNSSEQCLALERLVLEQYTNSCVGAAASSKSHGGDARTACISGQLESSIMLQEAVSYEGTQALVAISYISSIDVVFVSIIRLQDVKDHLLSKLSLGLNYANSLSERETIVGAREDTARRLSAAFPLAFTHIVNNSSWAPEERGAAKLFQLTSHTNALYCYATSCFRPRNGITAFQKGFANPEAAGVELAVNYEPTPVIAAYASMERELGVVLLQELRFDIVVRRGLATFVQMIDGLNRGLKDAGMNIEVRVVRRAGTPFSPTFDPHAPCEDVLMCLVAGNFTVWTAKCPTCLPRGGKRAADRDAFGVTVVAEYLTSLREAVLPAFVVTDLPDSVAAGKSVKLLSSDPLGVFASNSSTSSQVSSRELQDHRGRKVLSAVMWIEHLNAAIIVVIPNGEAASAVMHGILMSVGLAVLPMVISFALMVLLTFLVYRRIEQTSSASAEEVEQHKHRFCRQVEGIVPPFIQEKIVDGHFLVSQFHKDAAIGSVDVVAFTEFTRNWMCKQLVGFLSYLALVHEEVAKRYNVTILRVYGDCTMSVAGLEVHYAGARAIAATSKGTAAINLTRYAEMMIQLMDPMYRHNPHRFKQFQQAFPSKQVQFKNPSLRVGLHFGPVFSGSSRIGGVPRFDCYGTSVMLAHRMQVTSLPNRIHVTVHFKDALLSIDFNDEFDFEEQRKTVVRGQSTIASFLIFSANNPMPEELPQALRLTLAHRVKTFTDADVDDDTVVRDSDPSFSLNQPSTDEKSGAQGGSRLSGTASAPSEKSERTTNS